ncbi:MAG TPA: universal stress protein, partial [Chroococcales cyanobacterium]
VGSNSLALLSQASCPIMIIRPAKINGKCNQLAGSMPGDSNLRHDTVWAKRVLLAIEDEEHANVMLEQVTQHHWSPRTYFKICNVVTDMHKGANDNSKEDYSAIADAGELVAAVAGKVKNALPDCIVDQLILHGSPVLALMTEAAEWPADLVVVGSHGRAPAARWFLGSTSVPLLSQALCAVMVLRAAKELVGEH